MEPQYWQTAWQEGRTGFHQSKVNSRLRHQFPALGLAAGAEVFVPLCGKSLDMLWLHQQGYRVFGAELSRQAVQAFFEDNGLAWQVSEAGAVVGDGAGDALLYEGCGKASGLRVLAGDFFDLQPDGLPEFDGFYDRAALIAMPGAMRERYVTQLARLLPPSCSGLLLTIDYDQSRMEGPPFAAPDPATRALLEPWFTVTLQMHGSGPERLGNLAKRGLETLDEYVYSLQRHA